MKLSSSPTNISQNLQVTINFKNENKRETQKNKAPISLTVIGGGNHFIMILTLN